MPVTRPRFLNVRWLTTAALLLTVIALSSCQADDSTESAVVVVEPQVEATISIGAPTPPAVAPPTTVGAETLTRPASANRRTGQASEPVQGPTMHIDCADGDDEADGATAETAWRTIGRVPLLSPGSTIIMHVQPNCAYAAPVLIQGLRDDDFASSPITVRSDQPGEHAIIVPADSTDAWQHLVDVRGVPANISDVRIEVPCSFAYDTKGFSFGPKSEGSRLSSVEVVGATFGVEVELNAPGGIHIVDSTFVEPRIHALQLSGRGSIVEDNTFLGFRAEDSCGRGQAAVKLWGADDTIVRRNVIRDHELGVFLQDASSNNLIEDNEMVGVRSAFFIDYHLDPDPDDYPSGNRLLRNRIDAWPRVDEGDTSASFIDIQLAGTPPPNSAPNVVASNSARVVQIQSDRDQGIAMWCWADCPPRTGLFVFANNILDGGLSRAAGEGELDQALVGVISGGGNVVVGLDSLDPYGLPGQHIDGEVLGANLSWPCSLLDELPVDWSFFAWADDVEPVAHPGALPCS